MISTMDTAYAVLGKIERRGLFKRVVVITITDGHDKWSFEGTSIFTIEELQKRLPYFNQ